jgi:hypothetical protein
MREYRYRVDREGRIFHDETEIVDPATLRFFLRAMTRTPDGRWLVVCQGEHNWFEAEGTPFVVQRLGLAVEGGELRAVELALAGGYREPLDPATLATEGGMLLCQVRGGAFPARFGRVAVQQIAPFLAERDGAPALLLGGRAWPLDRAGPVPPGAGAAAPTAPPRPAGARPLP